MFFIVVLGIFLFVYIRLERQNLEIIKFTLSKDKDDLSKKCLVLQEEEGKLQREVENFEDLLSEHFLFYDVTRKIAPFLKKEDLVKVFSEEIRYLGPIDKMEISASSKDEGYLKFNLTKEEKEYFYVKTESRKVIKYIPYFAKLLKLCLERIRLYEKMQELSIYDSLTKVYNRRHFMERYRDEFERANKVKIDLSFLMVDIDYFKKINDTYGHLVGDAVLREVAKLIRANLREIDFIGRFGGEEFSVVLLETDKASAIMAAERISSRISRERIKVFDEALNITVSIGVAELPQNTSDPDIFIEVADKALYKAKVTGRNRVCWF